MVSWRINESKVPLDIIWPAKMKTTFILITFRHLRDYQLTHFCHNSTKPPAHGTFWFHSWYRVHAHILTIVSHNTSIGFKNIWHKQNIEFFYAFLGRRKPIRATAAKEAGQRMSTEINGCAPESNSFKQPEIPSHQHITGNLPVLGLAEKNRR